MTDIRSALADFIAAHDNENWRGWGVPQALQRILDEHPPEAKHEARKPHPDTMIGRGSQ